MGFRIYNRAQGMPWFFCSASAVSLSGRQAGVSDLLVGQFFHIDRAVLASELVLRSKLM